MKTLYKVKLLKFIAATVSIFAFGTLHAEVTTNVNITNQQEETLWVKSSILSSNPNCLNISPQVAEIGRGKTVSFTMTSNCNNATTASGWLINTYYPIERGRFEIINTLKEQANPQDCNNSFRNIGTAIINGPKESLSCRTELNLVIKK